MCPRSQPKFLSLWLAFFFAQHCCLSVSLFSCITHCIFVLEWFCTFYLLLFLLFFHPFFLLLFFIPSSLSSIEPIAVPEAQRLLASLPLRHGPQRQHREKHPEQLPRDARLHGQVPPEERGRGPAEPEGGVSRGRGWGSGGHTKKAEKTALLAKRLIKAEKTTLLAKRGTKKPEIKQCKINEIQHAHRHTLLYFVVWRGRETEREEF